MRNKILTILCILFGLMMLNSGLNKFFNYMPMPEMPEEVMKIMGAFMTLKWLMPLVALVEIAGGILIAIPKTKALGAIVILPVMVGIVVHHLTFDVAGGMISYIMVLINVWAIIENRHKYLPMLR